MTFQDNDRIPLRLRPQVAAIDALTGSLSDAHLNDEYAVLCRRMASVLAEQRPSLLARGAAATWAAAIVHAVGWVNFLSDPAEKPYMAMAQLAAVTNISASDIAAHSRKIRRRLYLSQFDPDWTLPSLMPDNPLAWLIEVDGIPVDMRYAPLELQEEALRRGFIPYIPSIGDTLPKLDRLDYVTDDELEPDAFRRVNEPRRDAGDPSDEGDFVHEPFGRAEEPRRDAGGPSGENDGMPDDFRAMIEQLLANAADSLPSSATMVDLNAALAGITDEYNTRRQAELGGLSPDDVHKLLGADWLSPESAIQIDGSLQLEDLASSRTLDDARLLLDLLAGQRGVKATSKRNLPRALVVAFRERMRPRGSAMENRNHGPEAGPRTLNEEDVWSLHTVRLLLELAGLMKLRKGVFSRTKRGENLSDVARAGELFALLLHTFFRRMNLAYLDGAASAPSFQQTIGFTFFQLHRTDHRWKRASDLVDSLVLPALRDELPPSLFIDELAIILETRFLRPLEGLGLVESREVPREPGSGIRTREWRKTALFGRVVTFGIGDRIGAPTATGPRRTRR